MIMPKNLCCLMKSHSAGGRSAWTWVISQSLICLHRSSTGPSRKACSSLVSFGAGCDSSWSQSGSPENSSPSKPTEPDRSEEHTSELQSLMRISYAVFCLKKKQTHINIAGNKNYTHI